MNPFYNNEYLTVTKFFLSSCQLYFCLDNACNAYVLPQRQQFNSHPLPTTLQGASVQHGKFKTDLLSIRWESVHSLAARGPPHQYGGRGMIYEGASRLKAPQFQWAPSQDVSKGLPKPPTEKRELGSVGGFPPAKSTSMAQCTHSHILQCIQKSPGETIKILGCVWLHNTACAILVYRPGIKPVPSAVEAWSVNHWTSREGPRNNKNTASLLATSASGSVAFHKVF